MTPPFIRNLLLISSFICLFLANYPRSSQGMINFVSPADAAELSASETFAVNLSNETEIGVERFPSEGEIIFIWQPHERGIQNIDRQLASQLAQHNIEVWLVDLLEAYFLPNTASNMDRISGDGFNKLIAASLAKNKKVVIGGSGRAAIPVLRGLRDWQLQNKDQTNFGGVVLLSPKLFVKTPDPGTAAEFMPIAEATDAAIYILQPDKSPWFWKLNQTIRALEMSGSDVYIKPLNKLRDRFYFRPDAFEQEIAATESLWRELKLAISLLAKETMKTRAPAVTLSQKELEDAKQERTLQIYKGDPSPPELNLPQLDGQPLNLTSLKGQVVLVNFWATWCPPCVHEMPSMQRLSVHFRTKPFHILGVNMAETEAEVETFLNTRVNIEFPIVMDKEGEALRAWSVFAFPTSYVVDKQGKIRYALFGSVEWDNPDIIAKIEKLINE